MKNYTKKVIETKPRLVIQHDEFCESPRHDSNLGYFITQDSKHYSPDEHGEIQAIMRETGEYASSQKEHIAEIKKLVSKCVSTVLEIYPITKYEHGGVKYSLGTAHGFDNSNNGFYIITEKSQKETGVLKKDFESCIENELELYNNWVNGEVYCFILYDKDGEVEDSCGGFYELEAIQQNLPKEWEKEDMSEYLV